MAAKERSEVVSASQEDIIMAVIIGSGIVLPFLFVVLFEG